MITDTDMYLHSKFWIVKEAFDLDTRNRYAPPANTITTKITILVVAFKKCCLDPFQHPRVPRKILVKIVRNVRPDVDNISHPNHA